MLFTSKPRPRAATALITGALQRPRPGKLHALRPKKGSQVIRRCARRYSLSNAARPADCTPLIEMATTSERLVGPPRSGRKSASTALGPGNA